jgi:vancomycin resistance protein YoaR
VRTWLVGAAALATLAAGGGVLAATRAGEALPGTTVEGVAVGGRDRAGTTAAVEELARARTTGVLAVTAAEVRAEVPRDLATVDVEEVVDRALDAGSGPLSLLVGRGGPVRLRTTVDEPALRARLTELAGRVDRAPFPGALTVTGVTVAARPPVAGRALDRAAAAAAVRTALETAADGPVALPVVDRPTTSTPAQVEAVAAQARAVLAAPFALGSGSASLRVTPAELAPLLRTEVVAGVPQLRVDTAGLRTLVARRAEPLAVAPRSAGFSTAGGGPTVEAKGDLVWTPQPASVAVRPGTTGRAVDVDAATAALSRLVLSGRRDAAPLPVTPVEPPLTTAAARAAGVRSLIGTFTTRFPAGQPRATNIRRIAELVDGSYVPAGEVFSLNGAAGRRTAARGFVADGAIVDGELTDEVGGGVSQFATTLFNAAFFAGLPILEHKPHSFYISRYPPGRESTVYYGAIDVKVRNDTAHGLLVRTSSTPGSVTVRLYGDNGGRRVASTSGPRRPLPDGGFRIDVTRTTTGGDGQGGRRVFSTTYDPVPPEE